jgi:hypothetical protein
MKNIQIYNEVCKVDSSLGVVFGWAIICKQDGQEYFDLQGDHIPEDAMLEAATDFMANSRVAKDMHGKAEEDTLPGSVVFSFPLTADIAKAFGITTKTTGLLIGFKPERADILEKFASGEYTGFSIGGSAAAENIEEV